MARINREIEMAGWRLHRVYPPRKWSPCARVAEFHRDLPRPRHRAVASVWVNVDRAVTRNVAFSVDSIGGEVEHAHLAEAGAAEAIADFQAALASCPGSYPLSRQEHAAQRRKMIANEIYRRNFMGAAEPRPEAGFPEARAAGPGAAGGGADREPDL